MPDTLSVEKDTGEISGTPTEKGTYQVELTLNYENDKQEKSTTTKLLTLNVNLGSANGAYLIIPESDSAYLIGMIADAIPTMTINSGVSGFKYFSVKIDKVKGYDGNEVAVFVHMRGGQQVDFNFINADIDTINTIGAGFNVKKGDVIKVFIVKEISNQPKLGSDLL